MTSKTALHLLALPEEHLPQIISYLTLKDICQLRLVSTSLDPRHVHHLWMDEEGENSHNITRGRGIMTSRRLQRMLSIFTNITSLRLYGFQLLCRPAVTLSRHYLEVLQNSACAQNLECLELLGVFDCDPECNPCTYSSDRGSGSPSYSGHVDVLFPKLKRLAIGGVCHEDPQLIRSMLLSSNQLRLGGPIPNMYDFYTEIANIKCHGNTLHDIAKITFVLQEGSNRNGNRVEAALHSLLLDYTIHHELCGIVANHIVGLEHLNGFSLQSLSNIVWAFTKVRLPHRELFVKIGDHIVNLQNLNGFEPEHICNTLWAFANASIPHHPQLFDKIGDYIVANNSS